MRTPPAAALPLLVLVGAALGSLHVRAQPTLRVSVSTILVDVVVRDEQGRPVADLRPADFVVEQDGRRQEISLFDYVPGATDAGETAPALGQRLVPDSQRRGRTLVLVIDDLNLGHEATWYAKQALASFIDEDVTPDDAVAVVRTSGGMRSTQPFTSDRTRLRAAIDGVHFTPGLSEDNRNSDFTNRGSRPELMGAVPASALDAASEDLSEEAGRQRAEKEARLDQLTSRAFRAGLTATLTSTVRALRDLPGRKGIVVISDGFALSEAPIAGGMRITDKPLKDTLKSVAREALDAQVVLYMINAARFNAFQPTALNTMAEGPSFLAQQTGGYFFKNPSDLNLVAQRSMEDLRGYYLLGYQADAQTLNDERRGSRYHEIRVRVLRKGVSVRARKGFYGLPRPPRSDTDGDTLMTAALTSLGSATVPVRLTSFYLEPEPSRGVIRSLLFIDSGSLTLRRAGEAPPTAQVDTLAVAIDGEGHMVGEERQAYSVRTAAADTVDRLDRAFVYRLDVPVSKPGPYYLRTAIRDAVIGSVGAANQFVVVPDVKSGQLALSGLVVGAEDVAAGGGDRRALEGSHPALRRFVLPARLAYSLQVFNASREASGAASLEASVALFRDRRRVYSGAPTSVTSADAPGAPVTIAGSLALGAATAPGDYALRVTVVDRARNGARVIAVTDFTLER